MRLAPSQGKPIGVITALSTNNWCKLQGLQLAGLGGVFGEDCVEGGDKKIGVGLRENQRGTELDHVVVRAIRSGEDAAFAQAIDDVRSLLGCWFACRAIEDQVYAQEKA